MRILPVMLIIVMSVALTINTTSAADLVTYSESYADKVSCSGDKATGVSCLVNPTGKFLLNAVVSFNPSNTVDLSYVNVTTGVGLQIGNWYLDDYFFSSATTLKYQYGPDKNIKAVTATFALYDTVWYGPICDNQESKKEGNVTLSITETGLRLSVWANTGNDNTPCQNALETSPDAPGFDLDPSGLTTDTFTVSIEVFPITDNPNANGFSVSTDLNVAVKVLTQTAKDGSTQYSRINLMGAGSF